MALEKKGVLWVDGEMVPFADATTHVLSHGLHYGSGVFEGIRSYRQKDGSAAVFRLREHAERLVASAKAYKIPLSHPVEALMEACRLVLRENGLGDAYIRPVSFAGLGSLGVGSRDCPTVTAVAAFPWGPYLGPEALEKGVRATISSWTRLHHSMFPTAAKGCGQYLNSMLATREAKEKGFEEAILLDRDGKVSEGAGENIFTVRGGALRTPGREDSILAGITRDSVLRIARDLGLPAVEGSLTRQDLYAADEVFFTGTAAEVTPVREIDGYSIGIGRRGPITERIQSVFFRAVRGEDPRYREWLTAV
ncbi:MAG: branched-chain amino acid transaminase [Planctomycetaceae bacterium]|nr:branched-chain amino acid transaminase [Planctomycetota bacterium]NUN53425.1 branched-chain amino acid transaminase [Planctomycetaceae bacterium]